MEVDHWEDAIDIDDSDLPSLLNPTAPSSSNNNNNKTLTLSLPPLQPCSFSQNPKSQLNPQQESRPSSPPRPIIPGPAGAVQAAMRRRSSAQVPILDTQGQPKDQRSDLVLGEGEDDLDFKLDPWLSAVAFLGVERYATTCFTPVSFYYYLGADSCFVFFDLGRDFASRVPIGSVKNGRSPADRISQVVGVVKSCKPNGLGDLFITLKDPTGTIGASIHRNVLLESNLGCDMSVGSVLILKHVAVFSPGRSAFYLNVTPKNVVKLISKDCGAPHKQMILSAEPRCVATGHTQTEIRQNPVEKLLSSVRQREGSIAANETRKDTNTERITELKKSGLFAIRSSDIPSGDVNVPDLRANNSSIVASKSDPKTTTNTTANINRTNNPSTELASESKIGKDQHKEMISRISVAQWTDDQLSELFADYPDVLN